MDDHVKWIRTLPKYIEIDDYLISHAFLHPNYQTLEQGCDIGTDYSDYPKSDNSLLWNREQPIDREWSLQICGHNSQFGLRKWDEYAICLDDSRHKVLTGLHMPSGTICQQEYIG
jgi:serine/threonine protein phosphatase 1